LRHRLGVDAAAGSQPTGRSSRPPVSPEKIGKYAILRKVGSGRFGSIYEARDPFIQRTVAVKTCELGEPEVQERFFQEAQLGGSLRHRNVTTVYDFGLDRGLPYMVEEFLDGEDLASLVESRSLPLIEKLQILIGIAYGLEYTHNAGIVHHDIKPGNVRVLSDGTVKLMDFGIARSMQPRPRTRRGTPVGTWPYLAPERITGETVDQRADVFSFGVLAYELLSGRRPFDGATQEELLDRIVNQEPVPLEEVAPEVSPALAAIVSRAMQKDPAARYPSVEPMRQELLAISRDLFGPDGFSQHRRSAAGAVDGRSIGRETRSELNTQEFQRPVARIPISFETGQSSETGQHSDPGPTEAESPKEEQRARRWMVGLPIAIVLLGLGGFLIVTRTPRAPTRTPLAGARARSLPQSAPRPAPVESRLVPEAPMPSRPLPQETQIGDQPTERRPEASRSSEKPEFRELTGQRAEPRASRYARAAQEPGLSAETRAATSVAGAWASYRSGDVAAARQLLRLAFHWQPDLSIDPGRYDPEFSRLAEQVRAER
jgi:serine/threonine protein kinase